MPESTGKIVTKTISPRGFLVGYQCRCGAQMIFTAEVQHQCVGCGSLYQLRVMIGHVPMSQRGKERV